MHGTTFYDTNSWHDWLLEKELIINNYEVRSVELAIINNNLVAEGNVNISK